VARVARIISDSERQRGKFSTKATATAKRRGGSVTAAARLPCPPGQGSYEETLDRSVRSKD
jgi:hypothetical protein